MSNEAPEIADLSSDVSKSWDEGQFAEALDRIELLQQQLQETRIAVPGMLSVFARTHASPQSLYEEFERSGNRALKAITALKTAYKDEDLSTYLKKAGESRQANPDFKNAPLNRWGDWRDAIEDAKEESTNAIGRVSNL